VKRIYLYLKVKNNSFQISLHSAAKKKQQKTFASIVNSTTIKAYQLCSWKIKTEKLWNLLQPKETAK